MTNKEKEILEIIKENPTIEQNEIAELLNISRSTVAVHISSLQKQGYLLGKGYILADEDYVVGIGAANVDVYGKSKIRIRTHYDHPADIKTSIGGVMHNIITDFVKLGGKSRLITAYSDDSYGRMIAEDCRNSGIDIADSLFIKNRSSGIFMQIQDENNDMYLAICDMSILESVTPEFIQSKKHILLASKLVVIDPSLPEDTIRELISICKDKVKLYIDPISDNYAKKIKAYVRDFDLIKPNLSELENLSGRKIKSEEEIVDTCRKLISDGLKKIVVSRGKNGLIYADKDRVIIRKFEEEKHMANASGAGDALMSALIYGEVTGLSIDDTIDYGLAAGIAAIRSEKTINDNFSIDLLEEIIKEKKK